ncbi:MAG: hypothetical protein KBF89_08545 [Acidimicrobiia bacterium]|jgi:hypothetical protein|nr:hypothetical protein [Acidimicrobiia bacterium]
MSTIRVIYAAGGFDNNVPATLDPQQIFTTLQNTYTELKKDGTFALEETAEGKVLRITLKEGTKAVALA